MSMTILASTIRSGSRWAQTTGLALVTPEPILAKVARLLGPSSTTDIAGRKFRTRGVAKPGFPLGEFINEFTIIETIPRKSNRTFTAVKAKTQTGQTIELHLSHNTRYEVPEAQR